MRSIGIDIHRDFMEVAIAEGGEIRSGPRVAMDPETLELFAAEPRAQTRSLWRSAATPGRWCGSCAPTSGGLVAASPTDTGMRQARAKTDRLDARALARLLAAGQLETVWVPDEATQAMRRRLQRRSQLVRTRSAAKNEIHAALMRRLVPKPGFSDLFGKAGRRWLAELELPAAERESVSSAMRQIEFCESEIAAIEKVVASEALGSEEIRRLMSVPGVGAITAAAFMAAVGDIRRFPSAKKLVGYLGLDPIVRQSGSSEASYGRISKQGSAAGRYALVEASWSVVKAPGPLRAFYERTKGRRGASVAIVATARKLACLFWTLLVRGEDYAYGQPSLTTRRSSAGSSSPPVLARVGAARASGRPTRRSAMPSARWPSRPRPPTAETSPSSSAWRRCGPSSARRPRRHRPSSTKRAPARHRGAHLEVTLLGTSSAAGPCPGLRSLARRLPAPVPDSATGGAIGQVALDFHPSREAEGGHAAARRLRGAGFTVCPPTGLASLWTTSATDCRLGERGASVPRMLRLRLPRLSCPRPAGDRRTSVRAQRHRAR